MKVPEIHICSLVLLWAPCAMLDPHPSLQNMADSTDAVGWSPILALVKSVGIGRWCRKAWVTSVVNKRPKWPTRGDQPEAGFMRSGKVGIWGSRSQEKTAILKKLGKSRENGCQSQGKVRIFVFFATWKSILVKNGLTFIAVILFNLFILKKNIYFFTIIFFS